MDIESIPMIADEDLEKFVTKLCYRPNFSKRTIPGIQDEMQADIDRMKDEIRSGGISRIRKSQLYRCIEGRQRMIADMNAILEQEERSKNAPVPMKPALVADVSNPYGSTR